VRLASIGNAGNPIFQHFLEKTALGNLRQAIVSFALDGCDFIPV
jgi:hypothetical protein